MRPTRPPDEIKSKQKILATWLNGLRNLAMENRLTAVPPLEIKSIGPNGTVLGFVDSSSALRSLFPVTLTQTGGSAGTSAAYCSFTYTVKDVTGTTQLATAAAPLNSRARIVKAACAAATKGSAYYITSGVLVLWDADETVTTTVC